MNDPTSLEYGPDPNAPRMALGPRLRRTAPVAAPAPAGDLLDGRARADTAMFERMPLSWYQWRRVQANRLRRTERAIGAALYAWLGAPCVACFGVLRGGPAHWRALLAAAAAGVTARVCGAGVNARARITLWMGMAREAVYGPRLRLAVKRAERAMLIALQLAVCAALYAGYTYATSSAQTGAHLGAWRCAALRAAPTNAGPARARAGP